MMKKVFLKVVTAAAIVLLAAGCGGSGTSKNDEPALYPVQLKDRWGFIDKSGTEIIPCKYYKAYNFSEGMAIVLSDKHGYVDPTGAEVIPCQYSQARDFSDGLASVRNGSGLNGKWGFIDKSGKEVIPFIYNDISSELYAPSSTHYNFSEGVCAIKKGGKWGFIDKSGAEVIPFQYDAADKFSEGLAAVRLNGKWGYIDHAGTEIIPCTYRSADIFSEGLALVRDKNYAFIFIDKTGKEVISCEKYSTVSSFYEGMAAVSIMKNGIYNITHGFIDKTGKEIIPCQYMDARRFSEGLAAVETKGEMGYGKWGYIDKTGKEIIPSQFDGSAGLFVHGLAPVLSQSCGWSFINKSGKEVIPCRYSDVY